MTVQAAAPPGLRRDPWLSAQLGRSAWILDAAATDGIDEALAVLDAPAFVTARVATTNTALLALLTARGMRVVDTAVMLERPPLDAGPPDHGAALREARPDDRDVVVDLARRCFRFSRFHLDRQLHAGLADEIKAQWVGSFFRGQRGDGLIVAVERGRIVGFLLWRLERAAAPVLVVDLVGVDAAARGRRHAEAMTRAAQAHAPSIPPVHGLRVGTQLANVAALRCYERMGFRVVSSSYVLHLHVKGEGRAHR